MGMLDWLFGSKSAVHKLPDVVPGKRILALDGRHNRTELGCNVYAFYPYRTDQHQTYVIIGNLDTGERFQINLERRKYGA